MINEPTYCNNKYKKINQKSYFVYKTPDFQSKLSVASRAVKCLID